MMNNAKANKILEQLSSDLASIAWWEVFILAAKIVLLLTLAFAVHRLGSAAVNRLLREKDDQGLLPGQRINTLRTLLKSILRYTVYFVTAVTILNMLGVRVEAILAGAGVVGLAVGFGAQNLIKDIITGFFILFEDQFAVGDYITAAGVSGNVEELGLRITVLRDFSGELHIVPNGSISQVTNYTRGNMRAMVDIPVAYEEDVDRVLVLLRSVMQDLAEEMKGIITKGPDVLGVVALNPNEFKLRVVAMTMPMEQWALEREIRRRVKELFDREGIRAPRLSPADFAGG